MKYADEPPKSMRYSTSNRHRNNLCNLDTTNGIKTKNCYLNKQVSEKKLCQADAHGKETGSKLLLQISEADKVSDFERILNSNAILWERARGHVWYGTRPTDTPAVAVSRPRSTYSLYAVSEAYHYLFRQHEESLQPLIDKYRKATAAGCEPSSSDSDAPQSILGRNLYDNLQDLSEFYEEDHTLREEIDAITDKIITEEAKEIDAEQKCNGTSVNFNVNLADLISLQVTGDSLSPVPNHDERGLSPEIDRRLYNNETDDGKEWLSSIMNTNPNESRQNSQENDANVKNLTQNFATVNLQDNENIPTITFSNCSEDCPRSELPNNTNLTIHLTVPSISCIEETRPPIM